MKEQKKEMPEDAQIKWQVGQEIRRIITDKKITQGEAGAILGIDQPKVSALMNDKLRSFSLGRLLGFLNRLGMDVTITITPSLNKGRWCFVVFNPQEQTLPSSEAL